MAELLVIARPRPGWPRGAVVTVQSDGWTWGREESLDQWIAEGSSARDFPDLFSIVRVPGVDPASLADLIAADETDPGTDQARQVARRLWGLDLAAMTVEETDAFDNQKVDLSAQRLGAIKRRADA